MDVSSSTVNTALCIRRVIVNTDTYSHKTHTEEPDTGRRVLGLICLNFTLIQSLRVSLLFPWLHL